jgi:thiol-disulfide isomerase/thioredoxin
MTHDDSLDELEELDDAEDPPRSLWSRYGVGALKALGAVLLAIVAMQVVGWLRAPALPDLAPDFTLRDLDGESVQLSALRGQPVVVNFWATWCGPCRIEAPAFSRFANAHPEFAVLGVAADGPASKLRKSAEEIGIDYRVLQGDRATLRAYGVDTFPTTVVVASDGRVHASHTGMLLDPQLWWLTRGAGP